MPRRLDRGDLHQGTRPAVARHRRLHYPKGMNARARQLLDELLQLSVEDRALIADELDASLDAEGASPEEVEKAWAEEITRRVQDVREGRSHGQDAFEVLAEIRAELLTKR